MEQKELTTATSAIKEETKMKNIVIINEQHSLLKQQEEVIAKKKLGGQIELRKIPAEGLNRGEDKNEKFIGINRN